MPKIKREQVSSKGKRPQKGDLVETGREVGVRVALRSAELARHTRVLLAGARSVGGSMFPNARAMGLTRRDARGKGVITFHSMDEVVRASRQVRECSRAVLHNSGRAVKRAEQQRARKG